jgi:uncharacterized protein
VIYLLDVNVLIALCDNFHAHYQQAHRWFTSVPNRQWATCPLTENGFMRITSSPSYPAGHGTLRMQRETLRQACTQSGHHFWPDNVSLRLDEIWSNAELAGPSHLTDLYLIALAAKHGGRLATFDQNIPSHFIRRGADVLHVVSV